MVVLKVIIWVILALGLLWWVLKPKRNKPKPPPIPPEPPEPPPVEELPEIDDSEGQIIIMNGIDEMWPDFPLEKRLDHIEGHCNAARIFTITSGRTLSPFSGLYKDQIQFVALECLKRAIRPRFVIWDDCFARLVWAQHPFNKDGLAYRDFLQKQHFMGYIVPHIQQLVEYLSFTYAGKNMLYEVEFECTNEGRSAPGSNRPRPRELVGVISKTLQDCGVKASQITDSSNENWTKIMLGLHRDTHGAPWSNWVKFEYPKTVSKFCFHGMPKLLNTLFEGGVFLYLRDWFVKGTGKMTKATIELSSDGVKPRPSVGDVKKLAESMRKAKVDCHFSGIEWRDYISIEWRKDPGLVTHDNIVEYLDALKEFVK